MGLDIRWPIGLMFSLVGVLLVMYSEWMLIILALGYLVSGVLARLAYSWTRRHRQVV